MLFDIFPMFHNECQEKFGSTTKPVSCEGFSTTQITNFHKFPTDLWILTSKHVNLKLFTRQQIISYGYHDKESTPPQ